MYPLRLPLLLLLLLVLLQCVASAPNNRYFSPSASSEQDSALLESEGWLLPELVSNPLFNIRGARTQRGLTSVNSHHIQKRKCQTATCVTQRLADFLVRSSNTIGTVYAPTNVGSSTYGKRDLRQSLKYMPL